MMAKATPPLQKNQQIELDISALGSQGQGIGRYEGYAVFVEGALAGEIVRAQVIKVTASYGVGKLLSVFSPSPERIAPPCPVFARCGGCTMQHLAYPAQLAFKHRQVADALERIGGIKDIVVEPTLGMDEPWRYRNKAAFPATTIDGAVQFGFFASRSHTVVPVNDCLIQQREGIAAKDAVRAWMTQCRVSAYDEQTGNGVVRHVVSRTSMLGKTMVVVVTTGPLPQKERLIALLQSQVNGFASLIHNINAARTNVITGDVYKTVWGDDTIEDEIMGLRFSVSAASFLQVNPIQTEKLYSVARDFALLTGKETVVDVYCGIGTISLALAQKAKRVIGIEIVPEAVADACANAQRNGISNAEFVCAPAETELARLLEKGLRPDVVVLDPPRKGCEDALIDAVMASEVRRIVYVSCNPATLARDCARFNEAGYQLEKVQPVDMFPQTGHVETVISLIKK